MSPAGGGPGRLTVLAGPTAVGKGTITAWIREHHPEIWISVSATTRSPRPGEVDGVHYRFVSEAEFDALVAEGRVNEVIGKMRVSELLQSMPGIGKVRARQVMEKLKISETRRVRGLGAKQVAALVNEFAPE